MRQTTKHTVGLGGILILLTLPLVVGNSASANQFTSPNFKIDTSVVGSSLAGQQTSTNYNLVSSGGESVVGNGASGSYSLGQGYVATLEKSLQVTIQSNGLVGYWPLDNSAPAATAFDESGNANNGTYSAGSGSCAGKIGTSFCDTNQAQDVTVTDTTSLNDLSDSATMTASAWVYRTSNGSSPIATKWSYTPNAGSWAFETTPAGTELRAFIKAPGVDGGDNFVDSTNASMSLNTWYHVAFTYDGSQTNANRVKMYLNGTALTTTTNGTIPPKLTVSTHQFRIGYFQGLERFWDGSIDDVKLYNRALTQPDLSAQYSAGNIGAISGLNFNNLVPGVSQTSDFDVSVNTDAPGYGLAINQNNDLTSGGNTIAPVSGTIGSPVTWSEGTTKGLGFTMYGTNATALPGTWNAGNGYAALPGSSTLFYTRTGFTGGQIDTHNMRLRLDVPLSQATGLYANQMIITGTMTP